MKSTFTLLLRKERQAESQRCVPPFRPYHSGRRGERFNTKLDVLPSIWDGKMARLPDVLRKPAA